MKNAEIDKLYDDCSTKSWVIFKRDVEVAICAHLSRLNNINQETVNVERIVSVGTHVSQVQPDTVQPKTMQHEIVRSDLLQNENSKHQSQQSQTQTDYEKLLLHPNVQAFIESVDKLCDKFVYNSKKVMDDKDMPSFDLGFDNITINQIYEDIPEGNEHEANVVNKVVVVRNERAEYDNLNDVVCSLKCGDRGANVLFASDMMNTYKTIMLPMRELWKEVSDYCLFKDPEESHEIRKSTESLVILGDVCFITREDMHSLLKREKIYFSIVNCWCLLLNYMEHKMSGPDITRFCFGTSHSATWISMTIGAGISDDEKCFQALEKTINCGYYPTNEERCSMRTALKEWITMNINNQVTNLRSVKMFLVPLYFCQHFTLYVINFEKTKVQYLDNQRIDKLQVKLFYKSLVRELSIVLEELDHSKAKEITRYKFECFKLRGNDTWNDCGVFLMKYLELFSGEFSVCKDLINASNRLMIRAEICATLTLADINQIRPTLLERVDEFTKNKPAMIAYVRNKMNEIKKAEQEQQKNNVEENKTKVAPEKKKKLVEEKIYARKHVAKESCETTKKRARYAESGEGVKESFRQIVRSNLLIT